MFMSLISKSLYYYSLYIWVHMYIISRNKHDTRIIPYIRYNLHIVILPSCLFSLCIFFISSFRFPGSGRVRCHHWSGPGLKRRWSHTSRSASVVPWWRFIGELWNQKEKQQLLELLEVFVLFFSGVLFFVWLPDWFLRSHECVDTSVHVLFGIVEA